MKPTDAVTALREASDPPLTAWIDRNEAKVLRAIPKKRVAAAPPPSAVPTASDMDLDAAIGWMLNNANTLVSNTVFNEHGMAKDDYGASGSTYAALANYAAMGADAPLEVHADALELLRVHSHSQLDRAVFDEVYATVRDAMHAEGKQMPREGKRTYIYNGKHAEKLKGGGAYTWNDKTNTLEIVTGPSTKTAAAMRSTLKGIARYRKPGTDWTIEVNPERMGEFAAIMGGLGFKEMSEAIEKLRPMWEKQAGVSGGSGGGGQASPGTPSPAAPPDVTGDAQAGACRTERTRWEWDPTKFRIRLYGPMRSVDLSRQLGTGTSIDRDDKGDYCLSIPTRADMLKATLAKLASTYPVTAHAMATFVPAWTEGKSALKQDREAGATEEGSWELFKRPRRAPTGKVVEDEILRITAVYVNDPETGEMIRWWNRIPGTVFAAHDGKRKSVEVNVKRVGKLVQVLRDTHPRLAEAIGRAYGQVAGVIDEEEEKLAPLIDLHDKVDFRQVTNPIALDMITTVQAALKGRGPADKRPFDFQVIGIAFCALAGFRALVADPMGLGKTIQGLGCVLINPALLPTLVVAPKNVVLNWEDEANVWLPGVPVEILRDVNTRLPHKSFRGFVICSYEMLVEHQALIGKWGFQCAIVDEGHYAKNPKAARTKALQHVLSVIPHAIILTGTPIKNTVVELHTLLAMLDPQTWGTRKAFAEVFVKEEKKIAVKDGKTVTKYEGVKASSELKARLATIQVRRRKRDALPFLPLKSRQKVEVDMTAAQARVYREAEDRFTEWLRRTTETRVRAELLKLGEAPETARQSAIDAALEKVARAMQAEVIVKMGEMRRIVGRIKAPIAVEMAKHLVNKGESVLVAAEFQPVIHEIAEALTAARIRFAIIDGDASMEDRRAAMRAFQAGDIKVIVASEAGKEGLTLTRACNAIQVERYWTPADEQQMEDRLHRIGQVRPVLITQLHVPRTIDDYMDALVEKKRGLVDEVLGDEEVEQADRDESQTMMVKGWIREKATRLENRG